LAGGAPIGGGQPSRDDVVVRFALVDVGVGETGFHWRQD